MFNSLVKRVFKREKTSPANVYFFEDSRPSSTSSSPSTNSSIQASAQSQSYIATVSYPSIEDQYQHEFYEFLFGKASKGPAIAQDELSLLMAEKIDRLIANPKIILDSLPVLPMSLGKIIEQGSDSDFDADGLINLIQQEPAIAAKVLELANSSYYNRSGKEVVDLKAAFMRLGVNGLSEGVINGFISKLVPQSNIYFQLYGKRIWQHSLTTGVYAKELMEMSLLKDESAQGYLIGLICRLGDVILYQLLLEAFAVVHPNSCPSSMWFKDIMCKNSKRLTYQIAKFWGFPKSILDVLAIQSRLKNAAQCNILEEKAPMALYVYEARIISELKLRFDHRDLNEEALSEAKNSLLYSSQAQTMLDKLVEQPDS